MVSVTIISITEPTSFLHWVKQINTWILDHFGWLFSVGGLFFLITVLAAYVSPLGRQRIGKSEPILSKWRWFSITLCTTIATGILFWGTAEPLFHLHEPPASALVSPNTEDAARFALSTMYMHWSFIPYSIYTLVALVFALMYYNKNQPFSLGALLYPLIGRRAHGWIGTLLDSISLFSLIAGMAASLGAGLIILAGGLNQVFDIEYGPWSLGIIAFLIVGTFILSAVSGLMKGIKTLSDINIKLFIVLAIFILITGPTLYILESGSAALLDFFLHFFRRSLIGVVNDDVQWARDWTMFNWANWLAWAPISAIFLGRIGVGYTVREFIQINLFYPSLFGIAWMTIISGTTLNFDLFGVESPLYQVLVTDGGPSKVLFEVLAGLPWAGLMSAFFIFAAFLSYVTAADSNTSAMSGISSAGISPDSPEPAVGIKIVWGLLIGVIAWVMITFTSTNGSSGLDGIRMLSNLGGFPVLFIVILVAFGLIKLIYQSFTIPKK